MSSIAQIMTLVSKLSQSDMLKLNVALSQAMTAEIKTTGKTSAKTSTRKGKPASMGTRAWTAYVEHLKQTMPERFAPPALPKERLVIAAAIRLENPEAYAAFCAKFKEENPAPAPSPQLAAETESASDAESAPPVPEEVKETPAAAADVKPKRVISDEQKAKMKAGREAAKAKRDAEKAAAQVTTEA